MGRKIMKNFLRGTFIGSLLFSLMIHLGLFGSLTVDWHLAEQWAGLKSAIEQIKQKLQAETTAVGKAKTLAKTAAQEVEQTVESFIKGEKLRLGPDSAGWKKLDEQIASQKAQEAKEAMEKSKKLGGGIDAFNRFISPPVEVELINPPPPKTEPEPGQGIEMAVEFKKEECATDNPKIKTYGGIGLQFAPVMSKGPNNQMVATNPLQFQVSLVPKGYPADKAGIQPGDIIEGDPLRFRGEIGSPITVQVIRNGRKMNFNMQRVKICYEAPVPPAALPDPLKDIMNPKPPKVKPGN
jgi:hypothetical protein